MRTSLAEALAVYEDGPCLVEYYRGVNNYLYYFGGSLLEL